MVTISGTSKTKHQDKKFKVIYVTQLATACVRLYVSISLCFLFTTAT